MYVLIMVVLVEQVVVVLNNIKMASEKAELDIKIDELEKLISGHHEFDATQSGLIKNQITTMERYSDILNMRLNLEGNK